MSAHPEVRILAEARGAEEAMQLIRDLSPDLIFLDIEMPGMNGFELLDRLEDVPRVIFTTGYDQYALKAFEVNALDYLLKPIAPERLAEALARSAACASRQKPRLEQVFVRDGERCWIVRLADDFLMESEGNYTRLCFGDRAAADPPVAQRAGRAAGSGDLFPRQSPADRESEVGAGNRCGNRRSTGDDVARRRTSRNFPPRRHPPAARSSVL